MMPGRFFLGVGSGENLNEHVIGRDWPAPDVRLAMLDEAIEVIRLLWTGGTHTHRGRYYTVESARLYTLPDEPPAIMVGASKTGSAELAARVGDAMINTEVEPELVKTFQATGDADRPRFVELTVCWAADERRARTTAHEVWSLAALRGPLFTELRTPAYFEAAMQMVTEDAVAEAVPCGPDPRRHLDAIERATRAGYTHVCLHQVGPQQMEFFDFVEREILPALGERSPARRKTIAKAARPTRRSAARARTGR